jgi:hypothetical protein
LENKKIFLIEIHILDAFLQLPHPFSNKKRIFIIHNSASLPFTPKRPTIQGRINRSTLPYPMEAKKREAKRSQTEEF